MLDTTAGPAVVCKQRPLGTLFSGPCILILSFHCVRYCRGRRNPTSFSPATGRKIPASDPERHGAFGRSGGHRRKADTNTHGRWLQAPPSIPLTTVGVPPAPPTNVCSEKFVVLCWVESGRSCWMTSYPDELPETRLLLPGMLTDLKIIHRKFRSKISEFATK